MSSSIYITLENIREFYCAGDKIKGHVILDAMREETIKSVTITFTGRGKVKIDRFASSDNHRRTTRGRSPFFLFTETLYSGHYTLKANEYTWPFEFTFPSETDPNCFQDIFPSNFPWYGTTQAHSLPPSYEIELNQGNDREIEGRVEYTLEAIAERQGTFKSNLDFTTHFNFRQAPRAEVSPDSRLFAQEQLCKTRSVKLIPDAHPSFKDKVHGLFKPNDLPTANFIIRWLYPTIVYPGSKLPLYFAIVAMETLNGAPSNDKIPVHVTEMVIKFKAGSHLRSIGDQDIVEQEFIMHNSKEPFKLPSYHIDGKTEAVAVPYLYKEDLKEEEGLAYIPVTGLTTPQVAASFATINVAVQHRLKVKMKIECGGKTSAVEFGGVLKVLPAEVRESPSFSVSFERTVERTETGLPAYTTEDLPAYTPASS